jgi:hypothetical protein
MRFVFAFEPVRRITNPARAGGEEVVGIEQIIVVEK